MKFLAVAAVVLLFSVSINCGDLDISCTTDATCSDVDSDAVCNGAGTACVCTDGYVMSNDGDICEECESSDDCGINSSCDDDTSLCVCDTDYTMNIRIPDSGCTTTCSSTDESFCGSDGSCSEASDGYCSCDSGYAADPDSDNGYCVPVCSDDADFDCLFGDCDETTGTCDCDAGYGLNPDNGQCYMTCSEDTDCGDDDVGTCEDEDNESFCECSTDYTLSPEDGVCYATCDDDDDCGGEEYGSCISGLCECVDEVELNEQGTCSAGCSVNALFGVVVASLIVIGSVRMI